MLFARLLLWSLKLQRSSLTFPFLLVSRRQLTSAPLLLLTCVVLLPSSSSVTMPVSCRVGDPLSDLPDVSGKTADCVSEATSVASRNKLLFNQLWFSDASLLVGPDGDPKSPPLLMPVHSQVITPASPALAAMFDPNWRQEG